MRNYWHLLVPDANDGGDSSNPPGEKAGSPPDEQATATAVADPRAELNATLSEVLKKHGSEDEETPEVEPKVEAETPEPEAKEGEPGADDAEQPPFHEHPRWKEQQEKLAEATAEVERLKPLAERQTAIEQYRARFGITEEQVEDALRMAALLNSDPAEARKALKPIMEALDRFDGERLPEDLAQKVKDAVLTEADAKEIARLRAEVAIASKRGEIQQKTAEQRHSEAMVTAVNQWEANKVTTDPDFKAKAEMVSDRFVALVQQKRPTNPQEAVALAERALADVNKRLGVFVPKAPVGRQGVNGSSKKQELGPPKTALEAAQRAVANRKD